jgi:5-methylcytosine-specific restriction endonuclease McrA
MADIRRIYPVFWKYLSDKVYQKHTDVDGFFVSATKDYKSKRKLDFQIDHIIPLSQGGKTTLENLQLLTRGENAKKGAK